MCSGLGCRLRFPHLVFLPELVELLIINGKLDKVQVVALDAEVQVSEPEHKAVAGREGGWSARVHGKKSPIPSSLPPSDLTELAAPSDDTGGWVCCQVLTPSKVLPLSKDLSCRIHPLPDQSEGHSVVSDSLRPRGLYSPWNSPGQNSGVGRVVVPFSRGSSQPRDRTQVSRIAGGFFTS